jgi:hypothetical protein
LLEISYGIHMSFDARFEPIIYRAKKPPWAKRFFGNEEAINFRIE